MSKRYRRPWSVSKGALATAKVLSLAATIAAVAIIGYYVATNGIQAVIDWFSGRWFALAAIIAIVAGTAALWVYVLAAQLKRLGGESDE